MATRKSSRVHPKYKTMYRVQNWPEYDRALTRAPSPEGRRPVQEREPRGKVAEQERPGDREAGQAAMEEGVGLPPARTS